MKKCSYCGTTYTDDVTRCPLDHAVLVGGEPPPPTVAEGTADPSKPPPIPESGVFRWFPSPRMALTDRQLRIFELILICVVAFGGSLIASTWDFLNPDVARTAARSAASWVNSFVHEVGALALLWYVLHRRSRSFADLGLRWKWTDIGWSILLRVGGYIASRAVFYGIYSAHFTSTRLSTATSSVGYHLFGVGVPLIAFAFQFLNPFFEELIVRAFVMTEIRELTGSMSKAVITSTVLQTSYHFYQGAPLAFSVGTVFLIYSLFYAKTNRIGPVILAHLYSDVLATVVYYFRT